MTPELIVDYASIFALAVLVLALTLTVYRVIIGPTLPDRVIALDMLVGIVIGFIAVIALRTGFTLYIDIAIALGLVGFLATVAFARFILARHRLAETDGKPQPKSASGGAGEKSAGRAAAGKPAKAGRAAKTSGKGAK